VRSGVAQGVRVLWSSSRTTPNSGAGGENRERAAAGNRGRRGGGRGGGRDDGARGGRRDGGARGRARDGGRGGGRSANERKSDEGRRVSRPRPSPSPSPEPAQRRRSAPRSTSRACNDPHIWTDVAKSEGMFCSGSLRGGGLCGMIVVGTCFAFNDADNDVYASAPASRAPRFADFFGL